MLRQGKRRSGEVMRNVKAGGDLGRIWSAAIVNSRSVPRCELAT